MSHIKSIPAWLEMLFKISALLVNWHLYWKGRISAVLQYNMTRCQIWGPIVNCIENRFQKCSQSGKNGSKHKMLSIIWLTMWFHTKNPTLKKSKSPILICICNMHIFVSVSASVSVFVFVSAFVYVFVYAWISINTDLS